MPFKIPALWTEFTEEYYLPVLSLWMYYVENNDADQKFQSYWQYLGMML